MVLQMVVLVGLMMPVLTEKPAQRQRPQEPDAVQHADAPEERQAEGEVRLEFARPRGVDISKITTKCR